jgi:hypothetical protein
MGYQIQRALIFKSMRLVAAVLPLRMINTNVVSVNTVGKTYRFLFNSTPLAHTAQITSRGWKNNLINRF